MHRFLPLALVPLLAAPPAPAAPVPKHLMKNRPVYYFPTAPGATWVYGEQTFVVEGVEEARGTKVVTVAAVHADGTRARSEVMEVSETGLVRLGCGGPRFDVPLVMLQAPYRVGTTWEIRTAGAQGTGTITALETIKVPAGTFASVRVEIDQTFGGRPRTIRAWYAPGVGLLKMTDGDNVIWLLTSFAPGKE